MVEEVNIILWIFFYWILQHIKLANYKEFFDSASWVPVLIWRYSVTATRSNIQRVY